MECCDSVGKGDITLRADFRLLKQVESEPNFESWARFGIGGYLTGEFETGGSA